MWKTCGENVEKNDFHCGKGVEFVGKIKSIVKLCKFLDCSRSRIWSIYNHSFSAQDVIESLITPLPCLPYPPLPFTALLSVADRVP